MHRRAVRARDAALSRVSRSLVMPPIGVRAPPLDNRAVASHSSLPLLPCMRSAAADLPRAVNECAAPRFTVPLEVMTSAFRSAVANAEPVSADVTADAASSPSIHGRCAAPTLQAEWIAAASMRPPLVALARARGLSVDDAEDVVQETL